MSLTRETSVPSIPSLEGIPAELLPWAQAITEALEVRLGRRGDALDAGVTRRDLLTGGIASVRLGGRTYSAPAGGGSTVIGVPSAGSPTKPTGFSATATPLNIILEWTAAPFSGYAYTEVWRSGTDDIGTATLVGRAASFIYADMLGAAGLTRYYWIRHVNTSGLAGDFNAIAGTSATTGQVQDADVAALDGAKIVDASIVNAKIGNAEITGAKIANATITGGNIAVSTITADKYSQLRNSLIVNGDDSLDASYPFEMRFPILSELEAIQAIRLSFAIQPFRAYTQSASGGGGVVTSTVDSVPSHDHSFTVADTAGGNYVYYDPATHQLYTSGGGSVTLTTSDGHSHTIPLASGTGPYLVLVDQSSGRLLINIGSNPAVVSVNGIIGWVQTSTANSHAHRITFGGAGSVANPYFLLYTGGQFRNTAIVGNKTQSVDLAAAQHSHTGGSHTHPNVFGIYEESNSPTINVYADNGTGYGSSLGAYTTDQLELDLTSQFSGSGWKGIKFASTARCRIQALLEQKLDITA